MSSPSAVSSLARTCVCSCALPHPSLIALASIARLQGSGLLEPEVAAPELAPHSFLSVRAVFDDMLGIETSGDHVSHYVCQVFNCGFAHRRRGGTSCWSRRRIWERNEREVRVKVPASKMRGNKISDSNGNLGTHTGTGCTLRLVCMSGIAPIWRYGPC